MAKPATLDGYTDEDTVDCERVLVTLLRGLGPSLEDSLRRMGFERAETVDQIASRRRAHRVLSYGSRAPRGGRPPAVRWPRG